MNRRKILLVDDDPVILKSLSIKLSAKGYDVLTATDGSQAVSSVRTQRPDLILLDLTFPPDVAHGGGVPWDGFLIIQWLKRMEEAAHIPIIVITGGDPAKYEARAKQAGATGFFHKPIDHDGLFDVISKALGETVAA
jgi:two-component system KDP operon response regulator KdpE